MATTRARIAVEEGRSSTVSRQLWKGLMAYNREKAGATRYSRDVVSARDGKGKLLGGVILQNYWLETYVELLWLAPEARRSGIGSKLIREAERIARKRGSRVIHLNTFSFQAPRFYEKQGYRRFGRVSGSPKGQTRYYYVKRLTSL